MLSKKERLTRAAFNRFFAIGKRHNVHSFGLIYSPHEAFHASVVVSKKVARSAVARNKIRRRIYDVLRNYARGNNVTGVFIVTVRKEATTLSYSDLKTELLNLIGRALKSR